MRGSFLSLAVLLTLALAACSGPAGATDLTIYAAASLTSVTAALSSAWAIDHPQVTLTFSTGSSAALRTQIEQAAPADVFMSADTANAQALVDGGEADAPVTRFVSNALTVIVPAGNPAGLRSPADLGRPGLCVVAAGPDVPITRYAEQAVAKLATLAAYGADFADRYEANVCSREDNVAAVVSKIRLGEGDAAIVYATDARATNGLQELPLPAAGNVVAAYGAVVVHSSAHLDAAREFVAWLLGGQAQAVFARAGFTPPS